MKTLNTTIVSRHYQHKSNVPTEEWLQIVAYNTNAIANQSEWKETARIFWTDKARTSGTAKEIAKNLELNVTSEQSKDWLWFEPESGPMKEIYRKLSEYYDVDPDVDKFWYSDNFVDKMQHNQLEGVDFNKLAIFNTTKLYNIVSYLSRNENKQADNEINIAGIHGGFFRESILYALRGDAMPQAWRGQIRMGENFVMKVVETDDGEVAMSIDYRGLNKVITLSEMKSAIVALR